MNIWRKLSVLMSLSLVISLQVQLSPASELHQLTSADLEFLKDSQVVEVYGILPDRQPGTNTIEGYPITTKVELTSRESQQIVIAGVRQAIESGISEQLCWRPHHAVKFVGKNGIEHTFVMCFECCEAREFTNLGNNAYLSYAIFPCHQAVFDAVLGGSDTSYLERTGFFGVVTTREVKPGDEIGSINSVRSTKRRLELTGSEIQALDYQRHPRATRFIPSGQLIRTEDFKYTR